MCPHCIKGKVIRVRSVVYGGQLVEEYLCFACGKSPFATEGA